MTEEFEIQGVSASSLAERFGTPLFVYDTEVLSRTFRKIVGLLPRPVEVMYSLKANPNISVCRFLGRLGAGAEVSSHTELITARRAGIPPDGIVYVGPGKSDDELRACVTEGIAAVVCESLDELARLDALAGAHSRRCRAVLRVNPAFTATGSGLAMGGKPRQFGIDEEVARVEGQGGGPERRRRRGDPRLHGHTVPRRRRRRAQHRPDPHDRWWVLTTAFGSGSGRKHPGVNHADLLSRNSDGAAGTPDSYDAPPSRSCWSAHP